MWNLRWTHSGPGAGFLRVLRFPLPFLIPHLSSGHGTLDQLVANLQSGLSLTPPQKIKKDGMTFRPSDLLYVLRRGSEKKGNFLLSYNKPTLHMKFEIPAVANLNITAF
jgi:hypothetical protein